MLTLCYWISCDCDLRHVLFVFAVNIFKILIDVRKYLRSVFGFRVGHELLVSVLINLILFKILLASGNLVVFLINLELCAILVSFDVSVYILDCEGSFSVVHLLVI